MTDPIPVAFLRRNQATASRIEEILGLPDGRWTDVHIEFSLDEAAVAMVGFLLRPDQLTALALLASESAEP